MPGVSVDTVMLDHCACIDTPRLKVECVGLFFGEIARKDMRSNHLNPVYENIPRRERVRYGLAYRPEVAEEAGKPALVGLDQGSPPIYTG
jgi:hypothetical protein